MHVYVSDVSQMVDLPGCELLTRARRERMQRYVQLYDKARCLTAGLMLRTVFGAEQAQNIIISPLGKPYLPCGRCFSLSHSGNKVVLLVSEAESGVDIEQIASYPKSVARRVFTPREQAWMQSRKNDNAFYQLWTGKESIMKALGLGFHLPPESFEILPEQSGVSLVQGREWFLYWQELDGHMLCVASSVPDVRIKIIPVSRQELLK